MAFFSLISILLNQSLAFLIVKVIDIINYFVKKEYKEFRGYGLHIYTGLFGSGKTSSMVYDAYRQAKKYPQLTILTNMELRNFPSHTAIIPLSDYKQIITAPPNTLILLDEISTCFNSRDWKDSIPAALLGNILQIRKQNKMLYGTAQRFNHVDALLRQVTHTVKQCNCYAGRWNIIKIYDALEWEATAGNTRMLPRAKRIYGFIQSNRIRELYDTRELVERMKKQKYISDLERVKCEIPKIVINN